MGFEQNKIKFIYSCILYKSGSNRNIFGGRRDRRGHISSSINMLEYFG